MITHYGGPIFGLASLRNPSSRAEQRRRASRRLSPPRQTKRDANHNHETV